jgi:cyclic beta-1,2-glucan synthetase
MNQVGAQGKGESVWLGWFLYANLTAFGELCERRGDAASAIRYRAQAERLKEALDANGWDGAWYRRAYYDDGTPLGSSANEECKIDAIAQAWAVISNAAPRERQVEAMRAVQTRLTLQDEKLLLLLAPPFVESEPSPGYIQGYPAGIRENGGQYTHGALWVVLAYALQGDGELAHKLFALLNPLNHTKTPSDVLRYKVEPYVVAADVYAHPQHRGRGGWTWYTGSAAWMYRIGIEYILGLKRSGDTLTIDPCIPPTWQGYELVYRHGPARYEIRVENPDGVSGGVTRVELDGQSSESLQIPLTQNGEERTYRVRVILGG